MLLSWVDTLLAECLMYACIEKSCAHCLQEQRGRKPRKAAARRLVDPEAAAREAMEKVDVSGLNPMQAWAAKQRAAKRAAAAAAPRRTTRSKVHALSCPWDPWGCPDQAFALPCQQRTMHGDSRRCTSGDNVACRQH